MTKHTLTPSRTALHAELVACDHVIAAHRWAVLILARNQEIPLQRAACRLHLACLELAQRYRHEVLVDSHDWGIVL